MKIEKVKLTHVRMTLKAPFETSFGVIDTRDSILVEAYSDGVIGYGECVADRDPGYAYETSGTAWHILEDFIIPQVLVKTFEGPTEFPDLVSGIRGHQMAKAGLELALWDLQGKQQGNSLSEMLGGVRDKVDVGVSIGIKSTKEELLEVTANYLDLGYKRIKIKIKPGRDVGDTQAVRGAYPDLKLQVDANSAYTLETAEALMPLDDLGLLLIEQPLSEDDLWDHRVLQQKFKTPICLDESIHDPRHARQALEMGSTKVINIKQGRVGGITHSKAIHDLCQDQNIPVWCGGMLETGVGRAANLALASLPNFKLPGDISATDRYYEEDITEEVFILNSDSTINVPKSPGLGISINQDAVDRVKLKTISLP
ncbi:MAG: o-succinylbenzoate synthase [Chloroflexi bacterium]|jgi:o-succinylbenzoate synthase|nr:o-succinylbenzoate synthase [Chloroflexota bacterium]MBT3669870.1 o-succinylbenzoate synthase [Chloroflexota bacterium]MBT4304772.1 o-succinylbenzoate synthase [Chloroflexota bacterium]MBT4534727.1 o-succinylbenzoate synthase [Chloroflexota bacterium]MBT4683810.1 o-succinylbenzoate synthase [Chloroflexota bacterium]